MHDHAYKMVIIFLAACSKAQNERHRESHWHQDKSFLVNSLNYICIHFQIFILIKFLLTTSEHQMLPYFACHSHHHCELSAVYQRNPPLFQKRRVIFFWVFSISSRLDIGRYVVEELVKFLCLTARFSISLIGVGCAHRNPST